MTTKKKTLLYYSNHYLSFKCYFSQLEGAEPLYFVVMYHKGFHKTFPKYMGISKVFAVKMFHDMVAELYANY